VLIKGSSQEEMLLHYKKLGDVQEESSRQRTQAMQRPWGRTSLVWQRNSKEAVWLEQRERGGQREEEAGRGQAGRAGPCGLQGGLGL
jgi:hypothetical protein